MSNASRGETTAPALALNHFNPDHNRCRVFDRRAKCKPWKDSQIFVQFWSRVRSWNMTLTLFVVSVRAWPLQLAFVQWGAPLMTLHRKQAHTSCCLRIRTFSSTPPLAQGSLHNSFVYSMASRWALKCGQALEHERSKAERTSLSGHSLMKSMKHILQHTRLLFSYEATKKDNTRPSNIWLGRWNDILCFSLFCLLFHREVSKVLNHFFKYYIY